MPPIRIAAAAYSNSAPLVTALNRAGVALFHGVPSMHLQELLAGRIDCALLPVAHAFAHPELVRLDRVGVAARGAVRSVLLQCHKPIDQILTVARDPASGTSNALAELLLAHQYAQPVEMVDDPKGADAHVVIGDRALLSTPAPEGVVDLAQAWYEMSGLPFVFALWVVRPDFDRLDELDELLYEAAQQGVADIPQIASRYAAELGREPAFWQAYLEQSIHYVLRDEDRAGLQKFQEMWAVHQLLAAQMD